jgi:hypothetical protein
VIVAIFSIGDHEILDAFNRRFAGSCGLPCRAVTVEPGA